MVDEFFVNLPDEHFKARGLAVFQPEGARVFRREGQNALVPAQKIRQVLERDPFNLDARDRDKVVDFAGPDDDYGITLEGVIAALDEIAARTAPEKMNFTLVVIGQDIGLCVFSGVKVDGYGNRIVFNEKFFKDRPGFCHESIIYFLPDLATRQN